jgi:hypothetical protein
VKGVPLHASEDATAELLSQALHCTAENSPIIKSLAVAANGKYQDATICFDTLPTYLASRKLPCSFPIDKINTISIDTDFLGTTVLKSCNEKEHEVE